MRLPVETRLNRSAGCNQEPTARTRSENNSPRRPYARIPLHQDLFKGPLDGRWGLEGGHIRRVYIGSEAARLEELLGRPMLETQQSNTGPSD